MMSQTEATKKKEQEDAAAPKTVPCSQLKEGDQVSFLSYSHIHDKKVPEVGTVMGIQPRNQTVTICWLCGYKSYTDDIPYTDMLAIYDKNGMSMTFSNIHGRGWKLTAE